MFNISAILLVLILGIVAIRGEMNKRTSRLPPGPPGLPLLGNILQLPSQFLYRKLSAWSDRYGPIYTIWMGSQPYLVLGSAAVSADVLDRMSAVTSDRPPMIKPRVFFFKDMILMLQDRTLTWRAQRRSIHASLNIHAATRYNAMQAQEAAYLALGLLQHPEKPFRRQLHRFAASVIFRAVYGGDTIQLLEIDPTKRIEELTEEGMHAVMPQNSVVDIVPFLKPLIQRVKWFRKQADDWFGEMDQEAKRRYDKALPTDVNFLLNLCSKYGITKHQAMWMTMALFMAGQETSDTALCIFGLAMLHHPEAVSTAQRQLDAVCGDRPPTFEDREKLPFVDAIVKETLRWRPGVPLSLPHRASEEFEYRGYVIPAGTVILDNVWSQTRDPAVYKHPESFDPTRFLDDSGTLLPATADTHLDQLGFGHGRRVCAGRDFALNTLFIACAYMLWAFRFEWPVDEEGKEIVCGVDEFQDTSVTVSPREFGVVLKPRKEGLEETLLAAVKG
ncbi:cytochrome P450 [Calocera viscosa TUFC12733]|uniref:Cytochrome P450 n=1 Tax=Calocera viscosa (strain TUFC12733) TaxID=1330018 RepID=A0A167QG70_CALVF|nr:cytochrome P450 [Calocera viscosa TUFC12733]